MTDFTSKTHQERSESKLRMALEIYEFHLGKNKLKTREMHKLI